MAEPTSTRLSTWDELVTHVQSSHTTAQVDETNETDELTIEVSDSTIRLRQLDVYGSAWVELVATIVEMLRKVPTVAIMNQNFQLPIGTLAVLDGSLLLRQVLPLKGLRVADLDEVLNMMKEAITQGVEK